MNFDMSVPVSRLLNTTPFFDNNAIQTVEDFHIGGSRMADRKLMYLRPRKTDANPDYIRSRFAAQYYTNYFGPKLNDIAGNVVACAPVISVADATDARAAYWLALNSNCDGKGNDLKAVAFNAILEMLKHGRGYLAVTFPPIEPPAPGGTFAEYKGSGVLNGKIESLSAASVDDWQCTDDVFDWVRTHTVEYERLSTTSAVVIEKHEWKYYAADGIYVYTARKTFNQQSYKIVASSWPEGTQATLKKLPNPLGVCPVFPLRTPGGYCLGDALVPTAIALFNREAAREFAIDMSCLALPILITDKPVDTVPVAEMCVLSPGIGGDFKFAAAPGQVFEAMKVACDDLRSQFDRTISALADRAAEQDSNARQSAKAKDMDREPKDVLLSLYEEPLRDALQAAIGALTIIRGDDGIGPALTGLDEFTGPDTDDLIQETMDFLSVPGIQRSPTACRMALRDMIFARLPGLSPVERKKIETELLQDPVETGVISTGAPGVPAISNGEAA